MDRKTKTEDNQRMKKMKNVKRLAALLLAVLLLAACAKTVPDGSEDPAETQPTAAQPAGGDPADPDTAATGVPETDVPETDPAETDAPGTDPVAAVSKAISIVTSAAVLCARPKAVNIWKMTKAMLFAAVSGGPM